MLFKKKFYFSSQINTSNDKKSYAVSMGNQHTNTLVLDVANINIPKKIIKKWKKKKKFQTIAKKIEPLSFLYFIGLTSQKFSL